jgi:hypothetical protein
MSAAASGAGLGESSTDTGISTSIEPTLYGPEYSGKPGIGLRRERYDLNFCVDMSRAQQWRTIEAETQE